MPQIASVGLVGGFRDDGGIGTQEEPAIFRRKTSGLRVLRDSGLVKRKHNVSDHRLVRSEVRKRQPSQVAHVALQDGGDILTS